MTSKEIKNPVGKQSDSRTRKRRNLTIPDDTWEYLQGMIRDKEAVSASEAVDELVKFRKSASTKLAVQVPDEIKGKFFTFCLENRLNPALFAAQLMSQRFVQVEGQ